MGIISSIFFTNWVVVDTPHTQDVCGVQIGRGNGIPNLDLNYNVRSTQNFLPQLFAWMTVPVLRDLPADFRSFYRLFRRACSVSVLQRNAQSTALRNLYRTTFRRAGLIYMRAKNSAVKDGEMKEKQEAWLNLWNKRSMLRYRNKGADVKWSFFSGQYALLALQFVPHARTCSSDHQIYWPFHLSGAPPS